MPRLERDDDPIEYAVRGASERPPMLLSHGFGASGRMWDANLAALVARTRSCSPGTCAATAALTRPMTTAAYTHEACLADMEALLDQVRRGARRAVRDVARRLPIAAVLPRAIPSAWPRSCSSTPARASATTRARGALERARRSRSCAGGPGAASCSVQPRQRACIDSLERGLRDRADADRRRIRGRAVPARRRGDGAPHPRGARESCSTAPDTPRTWTRRTSSMLR